VRITVDDACALYVNRMHVPVANTAVVSPRQLSQRARALASASSAPGAPAVTRAYSRPTPHLLLVEPGT